MFFFAALELRRELEELDPEARAEAVRKAKEEAERKRAQADVYAEDKVKTNNKSSGSTSWRLGVGMCLVFSFCLFVYPFVRSDTEPVVQSKTMTSVKSPWDSIRFRACRMPVVQCFF